ncbi:hypothetical protein [Roseateles puraquae]|uniref:hypothetical protein n=1 Tax=Roseateles puraquae TaxID=431059 RepID=UPI0031D3D907
MVTLFEHLKDKHHGLAYFIFLSSLAVVVISVILGIYFVRQDRAKKQARREERRERRRRGGRQKR